MRVIRYKSKKGAFTKYHTLPDSILEGYLFALARVAKDHCAAGEVFSKATIARAYSMQESAPSAFKSRDVSKRLSRGKACFSYNNAAVDVWLQQMQQSHHLQELLGSIHSNSSLMLEFERNWLMYYLVDLLFYLFSFCFHGGHHFGFGTISAVLADPNRGEGVVNPLSIASCLRGLLLDFGLGAFSSVRNVFNIMFANNQGLCLFQCFEESKFEPFIELMQSSPSAFSSPVGYVLKSGSSHQCGVENVSHVCNDFLKYMVPIFRRIIEIESALILTSSGDLSSPVVTSRVVSARDYSKLQWLTRQIIPAEDCCDLIPDSVFSLISDAVQFLEFIQEWRRGIYQAEHAPGANSALRVLQQKLLLLLQVGYHEPLGDNCFKKDAFDALLHICNALTGYAYNLSYRCSGADGLSAYDAQEVYHLKLRERADEICGDFREMVDGLKDTCDLIFRSEVLNGMELAMLHALLVDVRTMVYLFASLAQHCPNGDGSFHQFIPDYHQRIKEAFSGRSDKSHDDYLSLKDTSDVTLKEVLVIDGRFLASNYAKIVHIAYTMLSSMEDDVLFLRVFEEQTRVYQNSQLYQLSLKFRRGRGLLPK